MKELLCGSDGRESACNAGDPGSIPGSGRSSGEENGNPLQYSCLENPMDRGAWWAAVMENPMDRGAWWAAVNGVAKVRQDLAAKTPPQLLIILSFPSLITFPSTDFSSL